MKSPVVKRSIVIAGHRTSVSLEDAFWKALKEIAQEREMTSSDLVAAIDSERQHGNRRIVSQIDWRREWDSNPRWACAHAGFQDRCLKPLGHPSRRAVRARVTSPTRRTIRPRRGSIHGNGRW